MVVPSRYCALKASMKSWSPSRWTMMSSSSGCSSMTGLDFGDHDGEVDGHHAEVETGHRVPAMQNGLRLPQAALTVGIRSTRFKR